MNEWQLLKQVRSLLRDVAWPDGSASKVFRDSVLVSSGGDPSALGSLALPAAMIRPGGSQVDPEHQEDPTSIGVEFTVRIFQQVAGDRTGENVLLGMKQPSASAGNSANRGLLQIEERVYATLSDLHKTNGVTVMVQGASAIETQIVEGSIAVAARDIVFSALVTTSRLYPNVPRLLATAGSSNVTLTWALPPSRFDFLSMKLRQKTGASAPSSHTDGTEVVIANPKTDTTVVFSGLATTQYSFAMFAIYDDEKETPTDELQASSSVTRTVTTL